MPVKVIRRMTALLASGTLPVCIGIVLIDNIPIVYSSRALSWEPWLLWSAAALLGLTAFSAITWTIGYYPRHFVKAQHLPAPVAGFIGSGLLIGLHTESVAIGITTLCLTTIGFLAASALVYQIRKWSARMDHRQAFNEAPISDPDADRYGLNHRAVALANRIRIGCGPILIIGRYGSGKSSLANLIYRSLTNPISTSTKRTRSISPEWIQISVSGWGLHNPESRAKEILASVCDRIQDRVDTTALREECRGFLRSVFGDLHWIARISFALQRRSMRDIASQIDHLLDIANTRVLLVLDDFERNAPVVDGSHEWNSGVSEVIEHLKQAKHIKIIACVTKDSIK